MSKPSRKEKKMIEVLKKRRSFLIKGLIKGVPIHQRLDTNMMLREGVAIEWALQIIALDLSSLFDDTARNGMSKPEGLLDSTNSPTSNVPMKVLRGKYRHVNYVNGKLKKRKLGQK